MQHKILLRVLKILVSLIAATFLQFISFGGGTDKGFPIRYVLYDYEESPNLGGYYGHPGTEIIQLINILFLALLVYAVLSFLFTIFREPRSSDRLWISGWVRRRPVLFVLSLVVGFIYFGIVWMISATSWAGEITVFGKILWYIVQFPLGYIVYIIGLVVSGQEFGNSFITAPLNGVLLVLLLSWIFSLLRSKRPSADN